MAKDEEHTYMDGRLVIMGFGEAMADAIVRKLGHTLAAGERPCPFCQAKPGEPCRTRTGTETDHHKARRR